jgi:hypothetical protein
MVAYYAPPSSNNKRKYGSSVPRFIVDKVIESFD